MRKNRKSATKLLLVSIVLTAGISLSAYAAEWKQDTTGWWYEQDRGGYATGWQWIDGKCYYFADNGYMLANTEVDGYTLNADGQWVVDGIVQTQGAETGAVTGYNADGISNIAIDLLTSSRDEANAKYGPEIFYDGLTGKSIHYPSIPFRVNWTGKQGYERLYEADRNNMDYYQIRDVWCLKPSEMVNFLTPEDDLKSTDELKRYLRSKGYDAYGPDNWACFLVLGDYILTFNGQSVQLNIATKQEPKKELTEEELDWIGETINQDTSIPDGSTQGQTIQSN